MLESQSLTPLDIHTFCTLEPVAAIRSLGGTISRLTIESNIFSSVSQPGGSRKAINESLIQFLQQKLLDSVPNTHPTDSDGSEEKDDSVKRAPVIGLGRGAKDLASLRDRASSNTITSSSWQEASSEIMVAALSSPETLESSDAVTTEAGKGKGKGFGIKDLAAMKARTVPLDGKEQEDGTEQDEPQDHQALSRTGPESSE
jgi:hypothetical protein